MPLVVICRCVFFFFFFFLFNIKQLLIYIAKFLAEAYLCVTRLIQLFKLDFTYHSYRSSPVVDLVAIIIIVVKFIYGLDNEIR